ncbi:hypothetical protein ACYEXS_29930 [Paenibacillus sp. MAH-36]
MKERGGARESDWSPEEALKEFIAELYNVSKTVAPLWGFRYPSEVQAVAYGLHISPA